ncbi:MAG: flagellar biosynthetic protein FliO [Deltaproteobacteria bacterium]|nr:flagellar biosynthetic protein FliO [Deltaproteobacteria bacterium]
MGDVTTRLGQWFGQLTLPLWIVLACGIMAGAMVAQQVQSARAAEPAPAIQPAAVDPAPAPARPSGITFLDSPRGAATSTTATGATGAAPPTATADPTRSGFERIVIMLLVLAGGVVALVAWRKKKAGATARPHAELAVLSQVRVAGRWSVALVKVPGKTLVLGATDKGLSLLSTLGEDDIPGTTDEERDEERAFEPGAGRASAGAPPRPPLPASSTEPFGRLLDQLARTDREASSRDVARETSRDPLRDPPPVREPTGQGFGVGAYRDRMKTPEANALRARLERFQQPGAGPT